MNKSSESGFELYEKFRLDPQKHQPDNAKFWIAIKEKSPGGQWVGANPPRESVAPSIEEIYSRYPEGARIEISFFKEKNKKNGVEILETIFLEIPPKRNKKSMEKDTLDEIEELKKQIQDFRTKEKGSSIVEDMLKKQMEMSLHKEQQSIDREREANLSMLNLVSSLREKEREDRDRLFESQREDNKSMIEMFSEMQRSSLESMSRLAEDRYNYQPPKDDTQANMMMTILSQAEQRNSQLMQTLMAMMMQKQNEKPQGDPALPILLERLKSLEEQVKLKNETGGLSELAKTIESFKGVSEQLGFSKKEEEETEKGINGQKLLEKAFEILPQVLLMRNSPQSQPQPQKTEILALPEVTTPINIAQEDKAEQEEARELLGEINQAVLEVEKSIIEGEEPQKFVDRLSENQKLLLGSITAEEIFEYLGENTKNPILKTERAFEWIESATNLLN